MDLGYHGATMKFSTLILPFLTLACSEYEVRQICTEDEPAFDIEDVSTLDDAAGAQAGWFSGDGVMLQVPDYEALPEGAQWRVASVDVLWMVPAGQYEGTSGFPSSWDSASLRVNVIDGSDPNDPSATVWSVEQQVSPGSVEWESHSFEDASGLAAEQDYYRAWWSFSFAVQTTGEFMSGSEYFVGLVWPEYVQPEVGYSYFNRPCDRNWQINDGDEFWTQNSITSGDEDTCSWPMLRVNTEVSWESDEGC